MRRAAARLAAAGLAGCIGAVAAAEFLSAPQRVEEVEALCRFVAQDYAYLDAAGVDWDAACAEQRRTALEPADRNTHVHRLERLLRELHDAHVHLGTHTPGSPRLVPSQTDALARWQEGRARITAVRGAAAAAGLREGDELVAIDGVAVAEAAAAYEPRHLRGANPAARDHALRVALAGRHERDEIVLDVAAPGGTRRIAYRAAPARPAAPLDAALEGGVLHLRVNDSLGDDALVAAFDLALDQPGVRGLVLDLRDTGSGGNSRVARGLMGRLVDRLRPYQVHEAVGEARASGIRRVWIEQVAPRGRFFRGPVAVLVGPWTGSMGEGIAIGLHGARGTPVFGRPMAGLLGALGEEQLPHSGIAVRLPTERLSHVDGTPREAFVPCAVRWRAGASREAAELDAARAWVLRAAATPASPAGGRPRCPAS